jgi:hypothetical protein
MTKVQPGVTDGEGKGWGEAGKAGALGAKCGGVKKFKMLIKKYINKIYSTMKTNICKNINKACMF